MAPENTLAAVRLAWEQQADGVEIDVRLTRDGQIVAIHDASMLRTGGKDLPVADHTLAELQQLDVGKWKSERYAGERIPTLTDVLAELPPQKDLYIEIKCGKEVIAPLCRVVAESKASPQRTVFIGFDLETMVALKRELPDQPALWIVGFQQDKTTGEWSPGIPDIIDTARQAGLDGLDLQDSPCVDELALRAIHAADLRSAVWTVDDANEARRLQQAGLQAPAITRAKPRASHSPDFTP